MIKDAANEGWRFLAATVAPLMALAFAGILFTMPPQVREIYRALAEDNDRIRIVLTIISVGLASFSVWWSSHTLAKSLSSPTGAGHRTETLLRRWVPAVYGAVLPVILGFGLQRASGEAQLGDIPPALVEKSAALGALNDAIVALRVTARHLDIAAIVTWISAPLLLAAFGFLAETRGFSGRVAGWLSSRFPLFLVPFGGLVMLSAVAATSTRVAQSAGTIVVLNVFIIWLVVTLTALSILYQRYRLPILVPACLAALLIAFLDWNDNHVLEFKPLPAPRRVWNAAGPQLPFEAWLAARQDSNHFQKTENPYPIFIVAARGGGVYAAAQTAIFLARMQDRCPMFAEHLFAVSAVSGGSIGAAVFASLARTDAKNTTWRPCKFGAQFEGTFERRARELTRADLLSPLVAAAFFPDFLQRFLPWPVSQFDRAKAVEHALEDAWAVRRPGTLNPLSGPFLDHWDPKAAGPALLINTSEVETGSRRVISPFDIGPQAGNALRWFYDAPGVPFIFRSNVSDGTDVPMVLSDIKLSTAAIASARFPWIMPAATVRRGGSDVHLVDGGYFDNSGIETARDLILDLTTLRSVYQTERGQLASNDPRLNFEIYLISIEGSADDPSSAANRFDELLSPVRALLSTREARGELTQFREQADQWPASTRKAPDYRIVMPASLNHQDFHLALGFAYATSAEEIIASQIGYADECGNMNDVSESTVENTMAAAPTSDRMERIRWENHGNSCQMCRLAQILTTGDETAFVRAPHPCNSEPARVR